MLTTVCMRMPSLTFITTFISYFVPETLSIELTAYCAP